MLKVNSSGKMQRMMPNLCQNRRPYLTHNLFQFSASLSPIPGMTENATFAHFMKKSMYLKTGLLSDYLFLLLLQNGPQIEKKKFSLIDGFMTSEGGNTLILPFTSKTGQFVTQNRHKVF